MSLESQHSVGRGGTIRNSRTFQLYNMKFAIWGNIYNRNQIYTGFDGVIRRDLLVEMILELNLKYEWELNKIQKGGSKELGKTMQCVQNVEVKSFRGLQVVQNIWYLSMCEIQSRISDIFPCMRYRRPSGFGTKMKHLSQEIFVVKEWKLCNSHEPRLETES